MKIRRLIIKDNDAYYHCMSGTVYGDGPGTRIRFKEFDKEVLRRMIRKVADFSGLDLVSYSIMGNHFHVLVRVPMDARDISDVEVVRRFSVLYPKPSPHQTISPDVLARILAEGGSEAERLRKSLLQRMGNISEYMKILKQRFTVYYNATHKRSGTLWAERFKSVLVEGERHSLLAVAAYIDLNAVRAGLVNDPKDYRFCSYAEAVAGDRQARRGIAFVLDGITARYRSKHLTHYRLALFGIGAHKNRENSKIISREEAVRVLEKEKGKLPLYTLLRCRLRYFTDGLVLGSAEYVYSACGSNLRKPSQRLPIASNDDTEKDLFVGKGFRGAVVT